MIPLELEWELLWEKQNGKSQSHEEMLCSSPACQHGLKSAFQWAFQGYSRAHQGQPQPDS